MLRLESPCVVISRTLPGPCHRVWDLLVDTARWREWGPSVAWVSCADERIRKGSAGWVETPFGLKVPFRVTEFDAERFWAWTVCGIPATGHPVEEEGFGRCRLTFTVSILAAPYALVCWIAAGRIAAILK